MCVCVCGYVLGSGEGGVRPPFLLSKPKAAKYWSCHGTQPVMVRLEADCPQPPPTAVPLGSHILRSGRGAPGRCCWNAPSAGNPLEADGMIRQQ